MCRHGKHRKDSAFLYCEVQSFITQNRCFSRPARAAFYIFTIVFFVFSAIRIAVHAPPRSCTKWAINKSQFSTIQRFLSVIAAFGWTLWSVGGIITLSNCFSSKSMFAFGYGKTRLIVKFSLPRLSIRRRMTEVAIRSKSPSFQT